MTTNALRYGHAPGHLREAFGAYISGEDQELVLEDFWYDEATQAAWAELTPQERRRRLFGWLWHCTDTLPGYLVSEIQDRVWPDRLGRTSYAAAVQALTRTHED